MLPVLAGALAKGVGSLIGGIGASAATDRGRKAYEANAAQGRSTLEAGKTAANAAYKPYTDMGATATGNWQSAVNDRQQAQTAQVQNTTPQGTAAWLDPSANYSTDQANRAIQASAIARGGVGGGMARALANNAQKMAMTNWNNAAGQQLSANNQNFNQANTNYLNNTNYQQQQIENQGAMAGAGQSATNANQQLQSGYNTGINANYMGVADNAASAANMKGKLFSDTANSMGDTVTGAIGKIWGAPAKTKDNGAPAKTKDNE